MAEFNVNVDRWSEERVVGHVPDLAGCFVFAEDVDGVITAVPETIRQYHRWLTTLGVQMEPPPEPITVRIETVLPTARDIFPTDQQPISTSEVEWQLQLAAYNRQELLTIIGNMPADMLDWKPYAYRMSIREIAVHVGSSEMWYLSRITSPRKEPELELLPYLDWSRTAVIEALSQLNDAQRASVVTQSQGTSFPDEPWSVRKVLRRLLEHEREHITHIQEILVEWRLHFNVRLAADRARLFWSIRGLSTETMSELDVMPDWSVKDLLAHVAYYDGFHTNRMHMVANGRISEIQEIGDEAALAQYNAQLLVQFKDTPMEQAVAMLLKERSGFKATFKTIPDGVVHQNITLPWGWETSIYDWANWRYLHDEEHCQEIEKWRETLSKKQIFDSTPKYLLCTILKSTRQAFNALLPLFTETEKVMRPVCGTWSLKDVVGHLTDWEIVAVEGISALAAGQLPEFDYEIPDFDIFNNANAAKRKDQSWDDVWQDFISTREQLLAALEKTDEAALVRQFKSPWDSQLRGYYWMLIWAGHEMEHANDVRSALQLLGWPEELLAEED